MKFTALTAAVLVCLAPAAAVAQTTAPQTAAPPTAPAPLAPPSAEKLDLAKQVMAASGGADQVNSLFGVIFQSAAAGLDKNLPPQQKRLQAVIMQKMQQHLQEMTPQMMDIMVQVYAQDLTEQELRDQLAWVRSPTAQAMKQKLPLIMGQTMQLMAPLMLRFSQQLKTDIVDEACQQAQCSAQDRQQLAAAMAKLVAKPTS